MLWRVIESDVIPVYVSLGISQVVFSSIAQGLLTGKYRPSEQPPAGSRATDEKSGADMIKKWMSDDVLERVRQLEPLAKDAGLSMAQLAVAWVLQNDNVASAIIGASRPEQVQDNAVASGVTLGDELLTKIDKILDPVIERDPAKTLDSSPKTRAA
jgi:aryl-alcohol dehydrogenase-like predicted oxidoreductase